MVSKLRHLLKISGRVSLHCNQPVKKRNVGHTIVGTTGKQNQFIAKGTLSEERDFPVTAYVENKVSLCNGDLVNSILPRRLQAADSTSMRSWNGATKIYYRTVGKLLKLTTVPKLHLPAKSGRRINGHIQRNKNVQLELLHCLMNPCYETMYPWLRDNDVTLWTHCAFLRFDIFFPSWL